MPPTHVLMGSRPLRKILRTLLENEGYPVRDDLDAPAILAGLQTTSTPSLVLFGDYVPGMAIEAFLARLHQEALLLQRHAFLFLSTQAGSLPAAQSSLVRSLALRVLPVPWDRMVLLATLTAMEQQLPPP